MRILACLGLFVLVMGTAHAAVDIPGQEGAAKSDAHVRTRLAFDRQGGETVATAVPILSLPFSDAGATCDNVNDYDETCPFGASTSPDVVYVYQPPADLTVDIDLCGSGYDTKVYVYDASLALVACNDDAYFGEPCGEYVSRLQYVDLAGGADYYIVIDGYGGDCGEYLLSVQEVEFCHLACPPGGSPENEPPLVPGYIDEYNSGCGHEPDVLLQELWPTDHETLVFCGRTGWFDDAWDTDWFILTFGAAGVINVTADAEFPTRFMELGPPDCASVDVVQFVEAGPCAPATMSMVGEPGSAVWFWAGPTTIVPPPALDPVEYSYLVWFDGLLQPVVTEPTT